MDISIIHDYLPCLDPKYVLEVDSSEKLTENRKLFLARATDIMDRLTTKYYELKKQRDDPNVYLRTILDKLVMHRDDLFIINKRLILYRYNKSIVVKPVVDGNLVSEAASAQFNSLMYVINHLETQLTENIPLKNKSKLTSHQSVMPRRERVPDAESFELLHDVNLNEVYNILSKNNFIGPESHNAILQAFSGQPVHEKVVWYEANALQYFIKQLYNEGGIKKPNEGKWERTIKCFKKPDGDFTVDDLQNTHEPVAAVTRILEDAIKLITHRQ